MAVTLNASTTSGFAQSADTSGIVEIQSNGTTELTVASTGVTVADNLLFNSGFGSAAIAYGCRAWVNFNGTGTVAIRASGNVSSLVDNSTGTYIINLSTALPDTNYCVVATKQNASVLNDSGIGEDFANRAVGSARVVVFENNTVTDSANISVAFFR